MKMKTTLGILSTIMLSTTVFLSGCGSEKAASNPQKEGEKGVSSQQEKSYTLKVGTVFGSGHSQNVALMEKFKPIVEQKSGGSLKVEIYDNNKLGAEEALYNSVRNGTVEMGTVGTIMSADIEKIAIGIWPFLFKDLEHAKKVYTGPIGQEIAKDFETKHHVKVLAWSTNGIREFSSNKPLKSIKDFDGLRLRLPNDKNFIEFGKALKSNVTPLPLSEVFNALEQKVVDGQDNPLVALRANGWYEVQKYVLETNHMSGPVELVINGNLWGKLSSNQQKILEEAAKEYADYQWDLYAKSIDEDKKFLQEKGIIFSTPDEKFTKDLQDAVKPIYDRYYSQYPWAKDMIDRINAEAK